MKVYVITQGSYSAYHICAVTLDRERAEYLRKLHSDAWGKAKIEEYDTDETTVCDPLKTVYHIHFSPAGEIDNISESYIKADQLFQNSFELSPSFNSPGGYYFAAILTAKDEEHAKKIAIDRRAEAIAGATGLNLSPPLPMAASRVSFYNSDDDLANAFYTAKNC